ncbi:hypothetical protein LENED_003511 [Lentinula edodes]|uniref:Uncharacterized protein n=1 Tax=Lentinula edodes TaxID=5353 RepID=A0A1Q3E4D5_LENED|nr:hypothetical protein LENED_003511 [Lentinula edodes]
MLTVSSLPRVRVTSYCLVPLYQKPSQCQSTLFFASKILGPYKLFEVLERLSTLGAKTGRKSIQIVCFTEPQRIVQVLCALGMQFHTGLI